MKTETKEALIRSIEHWRNIVKQCENGETEISIGPKNCALCRLFLPQAGRPKELDCEGCPIKERTGLSRCQDTPYDKFDRLMEDMDLEGEEFNDWPALTEAAKEELEFLESLLTGEEQWYV